MSEKISWVTLRKAVASYHHCSEAEAGKFLAAMVDEIKHGLKTDDQVRIKGLGTFQVKEMAPRKSVNVNTGEAITIPGYKKMSFAAETAVREAIDRAPVSEEVRQEIDEILDPIQKIGAQAEEIVGILGELQAMGNQAPEVTPKEPIAEPVTEPAVEPEGAPEEPREPLAEPVVEPVVEPEEPKKKPDEVRRPWLTAGITVLVFALCLAGAYLYIGHKFISWVDGLQEVTESPEAPIPSDKSDTLSSSKDEGEIAMEIPVIQEQPEQSVNSETTTQPDLSKTLLYEELTEGSRLAWIAKKYYGEKDLWVFIYEANKDILPSPHSIKIGTRIRVPQLEGDWKNINHPTTRAAIDALNAKYE